MGKYTNLLHFYCYNEFTEYYIEPLGIKNGRLQLGEIYQ